MGYGRTPTGWGIVYGFVAFFMLPGVGVCYILSFFFLISFFVILWWVCFSILLLNISFFCCCQSAIPSHFLLSYFDTTRIVKSAVQIKAGLTINCQSLLIKVYCWILFEHSKIILNMLYFLAQVLFVTLLDV